MITKKEIEDFYRHVDSLGLKFPVAAITEATGLNKSNVSTYLNRKKEPSENFIKAVYEKFPKSNTGQILRPSNSTPPSGIRSVSLGSIAASLRELADAVDRISGISQEAKNEELDNHLDSLNRDIKAVPSKRDKVK